MPAVQFVRTCRVVVFAVFIAFWTWVVSVMLESGLLMYRSVCGSVCIVCCACKYLLNEFGICFDVVCLCWMWSCFFAGETMHCLNLVLYIYIIVIVCLILLYIIVIVCLILLYIIVIVCLILLYRIVIVCLILLYRIVIVCLILLYRIVIVCLILLCIITSVCLILLCIMAILYLILLKLYVLSLCSIYIYIYITRK